jgi:hypothetical protein
MMSGLSRGLSNQLPRGLRQSSMGTAVLFALKVIGVGLFAGLVLTYCNMLLDACMSGIR